MDMDMDMDIGWCMTCSKRTRDPRSPYCSEQCRLSDGSPNAQTDEPALITSPLPPRLRSLPSPKAVSRQSSGNKAPALSDRRRSAIETHIKSMSTASSQFTNRQLDPAASPEPSHRSRDRRAFSFPASDASDYDRPALPFIRKTRAVNSTARSMKKPNYLGVHESPKASKSTGANTPIHLNAESAVYSTSDSDDAKPSAPVRESAVTPTARLHNSPPRPSAAVPRAHLAITTLPSSRSSSPYLRISSTKALDQPVNAGTRLASSSSRSREDIITWARAVDVRSNDGHDDTDRGRRSRRRSNHNLLANLEPPSTEPLDDPVGFTAEPSYSGALNMTLGPVVKALRSVSLSAASPGPARDAQTPTRSQTTAGPAANSGSALGLQSVPAPAEVSIVDVVVATNPTLSAEPPVFDGGTPTLSTVSFSENPDMSSGTTDFGETVETATDYSVMSSLNRVPPSPRGHLPFAYPSKPQTVHTQPQRRPSLTLRSIQSSVTAVWNFSNYLRSLAPFTTPFSAEPSEASSANLTAERQSPKAPASSLAPIGPTAASPVPAAAASRTESPETVTGVDPIVRSVPMNIMAPVRSNQLERLMARSRSRTRIEASRSPSVERSELDLPHLHHGDPKHAHLPDDAERSESADADTHRGRARGRVPRHQPDDVVQASLAPPVEAEDEEPRGRRRDRLNESRERSWSPTRTSPVEASSIQAEEPRGRRRDRMNESRDRSWSPTRGRVDRSSRANPTVPVC